MGRTMGYTSLVHAPHAAGSRNLGLRRASLKGALVLAAAASGILMTTGTALGAGSSYSGSTSTGTSTGSPSAPAGYTTVLTTQTVQPSGGTVTAGGVSVTVPAGDFTSASQVVVTQGTPSDLTGVPSGSTPVLAIGVSFLQNGSKVTGTFPTPISVTITNSAITSADQLEWFDSSTSTFEPASQDPDIQDISVSNGTVTFQVTADPYLALVQTAAAAATAVPGATTAVTGFPVLGEGLLGALLFAAGLLLAWRLRRRPSAL